MVRHLVPWNASGSQLLEVFRKEMEDWAGRLQEGTAGDELSAFAPRTNVAETDKTYELTLELPGMKAEDFNIELHEGRLSVSGERKCEQESSGKTFHRVECQYGKFRRTFTLGQDVDTENVAAQYADGVLTVTVPKTEKAQPKRIQVQG